MESDSFYVGGGDFSYQINLPPDLVARNFNFSSIDAVGRMEQKNPCPI